MDEYRAVRERLETLDAQDKDLRDAIVKTRALIADLDASQEGTLRVSQQVMIDLRNSMGP